MGRPKVRQNEVSGVIRMETRKRGQLNSASLERGISSNEYLLEALDLRLAFQKEFWSVLEDISESTKFPVEYLVVNSIINLMASQNAFLDIFGKLPPKWNRFMKWTDDGKLKTGGPLYKELYDEHRSVFENFRSRMVQKKHSQEPFSMSYEELSEISRML